MSNRHRAIIATAASLGVIGLGVGGYVAQAPDSFATEVVVDDTADVLHEPTLRESVDDIAFHESTTVAFFSNQGGEEALTDDYALNDAVLAHAREERPEWLSEDGQKWADDLFIFGVDPEGRLVGTYFGENRAVGEDAQLAIQDAAKDDFRAGRWTEGSIAGTQAAADRMNAPFQRTTAGGVTAAVAGAGTVLGTGAWLGLGLHRARRSRRIRAEGDKHMAAVVAEADVTELHARLIPEESRYGGAMLRRYDEYAKGFRELTELGNDVRSIPERNYNSKEALERLTAYRDQARTLDHLDDVIADTAAFLSRDRVWAEAWQRQVEPVRSDLEQVEPMLAELPEEVRGAPEARTVREFASTALAALDRLRGDLEEQVVSPDDALDRLRATRDQLSGHLDELAAVVAREVGRTGSERTTMEEAMRNQRSRRAYEPTILSAAHPAWTWYAVGSFRSGYSTGTSEVEQSRASSSGGSTSGYGGGGSFSGAGSSSRF